jgi:hypothetical protein
MAGSIAAATTTSAAQRRAPSSGRSTAGPIAAVGTSQGFRTHRPALVLAGLSPVIRPSIGRAPLRRHAADHRPWLSGAHPAVHRPAPLRTAPDQLDPLGTADVPADQRPAPLRCLRERNPVGPSHAIRPLSGRLHCGWTTAGQLAHLPFTSSGRSSAGSIAARSTSNSAGTCADHPVVRRPAPFRGVHVVAYSAPVAEVISALHRPTPSRCLRERHPISPGDSSGRSSAGSIAADTVRPRMPRPVGQSASWTHHGPQQQVAAERAGQEDGTLDCCWPIELGPRPPGPAVYERAPVRGRVLDAPHPQALCTQRRSARCPRANQVPGDRTAAVSGVDGQPTRFQPAAARFASPGTRICVPQPRHADYLAVSFRNNARQEALKPEPVDNRGFIVRRNERQVSRVVGDAGAVHGHHRPDVIRPGIAHHQPVATSAIRRDCLIGTHASHSLLSAGVRARSSAAVVSPSGAGVPRVSPATRARGPSTTRSPARPRRCRRGGGSGPRG